jgi:hypothetical protein
VYSKMADFPVPGFRTSWNQKLASLKSERRVNTNKCQEVATGMQQNKVSCLSPRANYTDRATGACRRS